MTLATVARQVLSPSTTLGVALDGTNYLYSEHGSFLNGTQPYGGGTGGEASNVLKMRLGCRQTWEHLELYLVRPDRATRFTFAKYNGTTQEDKLLSISMPGGASGSRLTWGNGTNAPTQNRIYTAADNGSRTVTYGYTSGNLTAVTSPGGRTTNYGYGSALADTDFTSPVATSLLTTITDPRGLITTIEYAMNRGALNPNIYGYLATPIVYWEQDPNGVMTIFGGAGSTGSQYSLGTYWVANSPTLYNVYSGGYNGTLMFCGEIGGGVSGQRQSCDGIGGKRRPWHGRCSPASGGLNFQWTKNYDYWTEDLLQEIDYTYPWVRWDLHTARQMAQTNMEVESVETDNTWNFQGNPLSKSTIETITNPSGVATVGPTNTTQYAYWDATRYYQQKAIVDPAGRRSAIPITTRPQPPPEARGQKLYVYDPKNSTFTNAPPSTNWKTQITPTNAANYTGTFVYDSKGRTTDMWRLQKTTTTPWTYVQTPPEYSDLTTRPHGDKRRKWWKTTAVSVVRLPPAPTRHGARLAQQRTPLGTHLLPTMTTIKNVLSIIRTRT